MDTTVKLKALLVRKQISTEKLAEALGVDRSTVYRKYLQDCEGLTLRELRVIMNLLHMTPEAFYYIFLDSTSQM